MATCIKDRPAGLFTQPIEYATGFENLELPQRFLAPPEQAPEHFLYPDIDDNRTGFYIICPQEATNLVNNPTFFNNLDSWSIFNAKQYRQNTFAYDSGYALKLTGSGDQVTAERREYTESEIEGFAEGQLYVFSMYMWSPELYDNNDLVSLTISIVDDDGTTVEEVFSDKLTKAKKWERLTVTKLIREDATNVYVRVNLRSQDNRYNSPPFDLTGDFNLESEFLYADFGQFEAGAQETTPFHGDTQVCSESDECGNYQWLGEAHNGPSYRSACARDGGVLCSLSSLGFEILSHTGTEGTTVTNISSPYANKPGEFCEANAVNSRIITLTGMVCGDTCALFDVIEHMMPNSGGKCCGEFLLVFKHDECGETCESSRDLAICVTYIGGLEGTVTSRFNQRWSIQFKAHDPYWFEFPGHSSTSIPLGSAILSNQLGLVRSDGTLQSYPDSGLSSITNIECATGDIAVVGGPDGLSIIDCNEICPTYGLFNDITINDLARDASGNVIIGSTFGVSIYYASLGTFGSFPGYTGGEALAVAAPQWAEVVVGSASGVYIQLQDGSWLTAITDGPVNDLDIDNRGNIIAVGDFTIIDGVAANRSARFEVNVNNCLDTDAAVWESFPEGAGFDGPLNAVAHDLDSGNTYVGGSATTSTPYEQDVCITTLGNIIDSKGGSQELHFRDLGAGQYEVELRMTNITAQVFTEFCINDTAVLEPRNFVRITATAPAGTQYILLLGDYNITATALSNPAPLFAITISVDTTQTIGEPCETLDTTFTKRLEDSVNSILLFESLALPGGAGIDDTISSFSIQCVQLEDTFQGDSTIINNVAQISGNGVTAMGDGLPDTVEKLFVHPITSNVYAIMSNSTTEYPNALAVWDGNSWSQSDIQSHGQITDLAWCPNNCGLLVSYTDNVLIAPSSKTFQYCGTADLYDAQLIVRGPGVIEHFDLNGRIMRLCTHLECNETAIYNFGSSKFSTTYGRDLSPSVLPGSNKNMVMQANCTNTISLLVDPTTQEAGTSASLIWRNKHGSKDAHCCSCLDVFDSTDALSALLSCCDYTNLIQLRDPTVEDCNVEGVEAGDMWLSVANRCPALYVNQGEPCPDCSNVGLITGEGEVLHFDEDENTDDPICPETSP